MGPIHVMGGQCHIPWCVLVSVRCRGIRMDGWMDGGTDGRTDGRLEDESTSAPFTDCSDKGLGVLESCRPHQRGTDAVGLLQFSGVRLGTAGNTARRRRHARAS
jgi:hypothetical protein